MISENLDGERGAMKVVTPGFESANNGKELSIVDIVVMLCGGERLG